MVRAGGPPPPERGGLLDSLRGRLRDRGSPRRRRAADHGGPSQADEQIRLDGPPGEDAVGAVLAARPGRLRNRGTGSTRTWDIRLSGFHPLLGPNPTRRLGGQAQDGEEPIEASVSSAVGLVPEEPTPADRGSIPDAQAEGARPLRLLRDHGELRLPASVPRGGTKDLAAVARSPSPCGTSE